MHRTWLIASVLAATSAAPRPVSVRFALDAASATPADRATAIAALDRGMFADSLVLRPTVGQNRSLIFLLRGTIVARGDSLDLRVQLLNVLTQPLGPTETIRVSRQQLDSAATEVGRRYAHVLADRWRP